MGQFVRPVVAIVAFLGLASSSALQEPPKPQKEHEFLKRLVGKWDANTPSGKGTMSYKMGLGGLWLISDFEGEFGEMKFEGKGLDTYDPPTKKFRSVWVDSLSTSARNMEGTLDPAEKILTLTGDARGPDGNPAKYKSTLEMKDADTMDFSLFIVGPGDKDQPMVQITYKRIK